jgi:hypothetical protein
MNSTKRGTLVHGAQYAGKSVPAVVIDHELGEELALGPQAAATQLLCTTGMLSCRGNDHRSMHTSDWDMLNRHNPSHSMPRSCVQGVDQHTERKP